MAMTSGLDHLGLTVRDLEITTEFFTQCLGFELLAHDPSYPRNTVADGSLRLTLWQAEQAHAITAFDRKSNIGLHHVALKVETRESLMRAADKVRAWPGVIMEFDPEPLAGGPRMHMMFAEPGGLRVEIIWPAQ